MQNEPLAGKKTYLVAVAMVLYGLIGFFLEYQTGTEAGQLILEGLSFIALRLGLAKLIESDNNGSN